MKINNHHLNLKYSILLIFLYLLEGCSATQVAEPVSLTNNPSVRYKLPVNQSIDIFFEQYNKCNEYANNTCSETERLSFKRGPGRLTVERRVSDALSHSAAVYTIEEKTVREGNSNIITYQPLQMTPDEKSFLVSRPLPTLDIGQYLSTTQFKTKFEVDSDYPANAVKANFDRLMNKARRGFRAFDSTDSDLSYDDYYQTELNGALVVLLVESFPYRSGSKVVVNAIVQIIPKSGGTIDLIDILNKVEAEVERVIKA